MVCGSTLTSVGRFAVVVGVIDVAVVVAMVEASGAVAQTVLNAAFVKVAGVAGVAAETARTVVVSALIVVSGITRRAVTRSSAEMSGRRMTRLLIRRSIRGASRLRMTTLSDY